MTPRPFHRFAPGRAPLTLAAVAVSFVLGVATQHFREARAQSTPTATSTVYVPAGGLVFRTLDGRPVARIARDDAGGVVEIYDARGDIAQRVSARATSTATQGRRPSEGVGNDETFDVRRSDVKSVAVDPGF